MGGIVKLNLKRFSKKETVLSISAFLLLGILILQFGILKYQIEIERLKPFEELERKKVERYINYTQYGIYGFRMRLKPSPLFALLCYSTTISDLDGFIDSGVRLKFQEPKTAETLFDSPTKNGMDLSRYIYFSCVLVLIWGFFSYGNPEQLKLFLNFKIPLLKIFFGVILSKSIIMITALSLLTAIVYFQFSVNGISLSLSDICGLFIFLLNSIIIMIMSLIIGATFGTIKNKLKGAICGITAWCVFFFLWPQAVNYYFSLVIAPSMKSQYEHELQKLDILMKFEMEALEAANSPRYKTKEEKFESDRKMSDYYWNDVSLKIQKIEMELLNSLRRELSRYHLISTFNSFTFFQSTLNEVSSMGLCSYVDFGSKNLNLQRKFLRFYFDKRFYEKYKTVIPFQSNHVIESHPRIPFYFSWGLVFNLCLICLLSFICYACVFSAVYPKQKSKIQNPFKSHPISGLIQIKAGNDVKAYLANCLFGKRQCELPFEHFEYRVYMPPASSLPGDLYIRDFFFFVKERTGVDLRLQAKHFYKCFKELTTLEKEEILLDAALAAIKPGPGIQKAIIITNEFFYYPRHPDKEVQGRMEKKLQDFTDRGGTILFLRENISWYPKFQKTLEITINGNTCNLNGMESEFKDILGRITRKPHQKPLSIELENA